VYLKETATQKSKRSPAPSNSSSLGSSFLGSSFLAAGAGAEDLAAATGAAVEAPAPMVPTFPRPAAIIYEELIEIRTQ